MDIVCKTCSLNRSTHGKRLGLDRADLVSKCQILSQDQLMKFFGYTNTCNSLTRPACIKLLDWHNSLTRPTHVKFFD